MKGLAAAIAMLLALTASAQARQGASRDSRACLVEVLYSEELPIGPLFQYVIKESLLVTPPGAAPFETTVQRMIPWQMPPPRRGQRVRVSCDSVASNSFFGIF
jgi:hypothetical protein